MLEDYYRAAWHDNDFVPLESHQSTLLDVR